MTPAETYDAVWEALKNRPKRILSTSAQMRQAMSDTRAALNSVGVELTDLQISRLYSSDKILTLWDETEYVLERHYGRCGLRVIWPNRGETIRVERKK